MLSWEHFTYTLHITEREDRKEDRTDVIVEESERPKLYTGELILQYLNLHRLACRPTSTFEQYITFPYNKANIVILIHVYMYKYYLFFCPQHTFIFKFLLMLFYY